MKRTASLLVFALALPSIAAAHIGIRPRESKPSAEERYTVRVPTEGAVATTSVRLEIPQGIAVLDVERSYAATVETETSGGRIVAIIWTKRIEPKESAEFFFRARNPEFGTEIVWKAHQHFADGAVTNWVGPSGDRRPAPVTRLTAGQPAAMQRGAGGVDAGEIEAWFRGYDAAFNAKDLDKLAAFYHPEVTVYEGGGINNGWADYRDHHLGPELKAFENLQFGHRELKVNLLGGGEAAYATARYSLKAKMGDRDIDAEGLATYVLVEGSDGAWTIRQSHTSSRPARRPGGQ